jgi:Pyridine nucleotide-disulphide oxidoreductase
VRLCNRIDNFFKLTCSARYDKLVIAVGSVSSTHGVPGLEHCFQLKTVSDARTIRRRILGEYSYYPNVIGRCIRISDNFETASLPSTSEEERKRLLSFVVCGGGPTGVETAAVRLPAYSRSVYSLILSLGDLRSMPRGHHQLRTFRSSVGPYGLVTNFLVSPDMSGRGINSCGPV